MRVWKIGFLILIGAFILLPFVSRAEVVVSVTESAAIKVDFFSRKNCDYCGQVEEKLKTIPTEKFIITRHYADDNATDQNYLQTIANANNLTLAQRTTLPLFYLSDVKIFIGGFDNVSKFLDNPATYVNNKISVFGSDGCSPDKPCAVTPLSGAPSRFSLLLSTVGLALADSINPCEFAILILLLTNILALSGEHKKAIYSGLAFAGAIFIVYFGFALGMFSVLKIAGVMTWFKIIIGALSVVLGALNIKDAINYGGGGFLMEVPLKWRPTMKGIVKRATDPVGAFIAGLVVAFILTPCTAGPLTIFAGIMSQLGSFWATIWYFILYDLVFILPMVAITFGLVFGLNLRQAETTRQRNVKLIHLVIGLILIIIGVLVMLNIV